MIVLPSISFDEVSPLQLSIDGKLSKSLLLNNLFVGDANNIAVETAPNLALNIILPSQSTHAGKFLTTDGTDTNWAAISGTLSGGVTNFIPKWTSPTTQSSSQIFDNGTFVGIGVSNAAHKLDIDNPGAGIVATQRLQNTITAAINNGSQLLFAANRTTSGLTNIAGIAGMITDITDTAYKGALILSTANNAVPSEKVRITHDGRVGINTDNPEAALQINFNGNPAPFMPFRVNNTSFTNTSFNSPSTGIFLGQNTVFSLGLQSFASGGAAFYAASTNVESLAFIGISRTDNAGASILFSGTRYNVGAIDVRALTASEKLFQIENSSSPGVTFGTKVLTIMGDGKAGFGDGLIPTARIDILSNSTTIPLKARGGSASTNIFVCETNAGARRMTLSDTGLSIGDNITDGAGFNAEAKLHVGSIGANLNTAIIEVNQVGTALADLNGIIISNWNGTVNNFAGINFCDLHNNIADRTAVIGIQFTDRINHFGDIVFATRNIAGFLERMRIDKNGNIRAKTLHNNATPQGGSNNQDIRSGTFTPAYAIVANLDTLSGTVIQWKRIGNVVTVSGRFTADPTLTATATSFTITLPINPGFTAINELAGTAFCGSVEGQGAEILADVVGNKAKVQWVASDITSQSWSYHFTYQILIADA